MSAASRPIGVFDSGVGGLTVVRALMERLPLEDIVYFGDTARVPYGVKSVATIEHFTAQITEFLLQRDVKMLIIACNTMAAVAAEVVHRLAAGIPVLDVIEAGARAAVAASPGRRIGVIGTPTTINSNAYARRMHELDPAVRVHSQACPLFVPLVEEGWLDHEVTRLTAQEYLRPVLAEEVDSLVLGCTHYPLVAEEIRALVGPDVVLLDTAEAVARELERRLSQERLLRVDARDSGELALHTSGDPLRLQQQLRHWMADLGDAMVLESASLDLPADRSPITRSL